MMVADIEKEIEALGREEGESKERIVAAAELARRALDLGELGLFVRAKSGEARDARFLGMHQHCVVTCAELMEVLPRVLALPAVDDKVEKRLVWGLKYGAGSAMDLPEIPLSTVRDLLGALGRTLERFGRSPIARWELTARLAFIEGDAQTLKDLVAKIAPLVSLRSHLYDHADCPGCTLLQIAKWLGPDAPASEVEAVLEPVFSKRPFPRDASMQQFFALFYGSDPMCDNAKRQAPALLARAHARSGSLAEARREVGEALGRTEGTAAERRVRALVAALHRARRGRPRLARAALRGARADPAGSGGPVRVARSRGRAPSRVRQARRSGQAGGALRRNARAGAPARRAPPLAAPRARDDRRVRPRMRPTHGSDPPLALNP
jgi:hypothetical protein